VNAIADLPAECESADMPNRGGAAMFSRLFALAILWFAATAAAPAGPPQRIVAVGDLHGDYDAWVQIARAAGLIDARGHWAGGKTMLVQLGDVTDREPDSLKIIRSLQQLQKEAPRSGGRVVVALGDHESMNLLGDLRYTTPGEFAAFADADSTARRDRAFELNRTAIEAVYRARDPKLSPAAIRQAWLAATPLGWVEHRLAWGPSGELGKWATRNPAVVKVGGTLFVHGGLSAEYAKRSIDEINRRFATAMAAADDSPATILYDPLGPLWYRGLVRRDADAQAARAASHAAPLSVDQELDAVLSAYGAQRMVIGHTPDLRGIQITNGGRLALIDTGISRFYGGPLSWLEIIGDRMIPHDMKRSAP
jgi:hypothetical protein